MTVHVLNKVLVLKRLSLEDSCNIKSPIKKRKSNESFGHRRLNNCMEWSTFWVPYREFRVSITRAASANQKVSDKIPRKNPEECTPRLAHKLKVEKKQKIGGFSDNMW